jgi:hypothetical protein
LFNAFVGRAHEPAEAPIQQSGQLYGEIQRFTSIAAWQLHQRVGGVMTPPYDVPLLKTIISFRKREFP